MGLLYSTMVFQPPRPPQYSLESHSDVFWIRTTNESRIPVLFYNSGTLERPVVRDCSQHSRAYDSKHERDCSSRVFGKKRPKLSRCSDLAATVDQSEIDALLRSARCRLGSSRRHGRQSAQNEQIPCSLLDISKDSGGSACSSSHAYLPFPRRQKQGYSEEFFTILYSHGNAEDLASAGAYIQLLTAALGCSALAYDYTGYGLSLPSGMGPSENRFYRDIYACYRYLIHIGVPPERILLVGRSIGTGPTIELASKVPVGGVILIAPLMSCLRVLDPDIRFTIPCLDMFPSVDRMHLIKAPVLIIHGLQDDVVPACHGKRLYERCSQKTEPLWLEKASHNDIELHYLSNVLLRIRSFMRYCAAFFSEREIRVTESTRSPMQNILSCFQCTRFGPWR
jgi:pimeloyl-ACP methyl ester carboxylesterase